MFKRLFTLLIFLILSLIVFLLVLNLVKIKKNSQKTTIIKVPVVKITPTKNKMFFTYEKENIDKTNEIISIKLDGPADIKADAIDLRLDFDSNITIDEIATGSSFLSYPRTVVKDNYLQVTGVGLDLKNNLLLAKPKTTFVQIKLKIKNPNQKSSLKLNFEESRIYLSGQDITDQQGSFSVINF